MSDQTPKQTKASSQASLQPSQVEAAGQTGIKNWIEHRLPVFSFLNKELIDYPTPKNLNYLWNFGSLAGITLVLMILSGIFLAMQYTAYADQAFDSVERIMREVNYGWLIRYLHMNGASIFFIVVYIHIFRGLYYGSYKAPRELLWIMGVAILLLMMATAFMGYVLPWGQMSFWGATVITNFFTAFDIQFVLFGKPVSLKIGTAIMEWLLGGYSVNNPTLNRFFALHYLLPFLIVGLVALHLIALHIHGSNNPLGVDKKTPKDTVPFHPYYTYKDLFGLGVLLTFFAIVVFFAPNFFGEPDNYIPANPLVTPPHIVPEWYFLPFYAILRAVPDKLLGVILMFASVVILALLPWLDKSPIRSAKFRPLYRIAFWVFFVAVIALGWVGSQAPEGIVVTVGWVATLYYFLHFLVVIPALNYIERPHPLPHSIDSYLSTKQERA
jgi:ubiquinol-cytochrome c reductase cytochrome b subunit